MGLGCFWTIACRLIRLALVMSDAAEANVPLIRKSYDTFGKATHGKVGMWIFLGTDALTFAGFLMGYAILRVRNPDWPNPEQYLGINLSAAATFLLICSSVTMVVAQAWGEAGNTKKMARYIALTACGGMVFLGIQVYEYLHLYHAMGMTFNDFLHGPPQFASSFFLITGFHGFHVLSGVIYLWVIFFRILRGHYGGGNVNHVELCGLFWHFVDLVWILVFTFIYLL